MFLTADELRDLTGRTMPSAQIRWLKANNWVFAIRADGRPVVARAEAENQLCSTPPKRDVYEPNLAALDALPDRRRRG